MYIIIIIIVCTCIVFNMYDVSARGVDERMIYVIIIIIIVVVVRLYSAHTAASVCDFLTCAEMLMHAIAHMGCANTVRESALKGDSLGEKNLSQRGSRTLRNCAEIVHICHCTTFYPPDIFTKI